MGIFPPGASKASSATGVDSNIGGLVHYDDEGAIVLGVITGTKRDKFVVLTTKGRELELQRGRLYRLPGAPLLLPSTSSARVEALTTLAASIEKEASSLDVAELWSFVHEESRLFTVSELCQSYFGADTPEKHGGLRVALIRERVHFKRDKDGFEPRSAEVVESLKVAEEAKKRKLTIREATLTFVERRTKDPTTAIPTGVEDNLRLIGEVAAGVPHTDPARQKEGKELTHLCARTAHVSENAPIERQAFEVLIKVGYFSPHSNLSFIRHDIPVTFPPAALREADALIVANAVTDFPEDEQRFRVDLTSRHAITIDDVSTKDMDDALSIDRTPEGYELGIHITDVAWLIRPDSELDVVARRRATSLYCADRTVNMLPDTLAESKISLLAGAVRPCISVLVSLDEAYRIQGFSVKPSFVRVAQRYSYDDVDLLLEHEDETLMLLYQIAAAAEEERIRKGAVKVHRREVVPFLEEDGSIRLLEIDEDSPARALVAEMMVLANSCMAQFAVAHSLPVIFRGQERADENANKAVSEAPDGPAKDFTTRSKLKKSTMTLDPQHHSGLGLDAYIQATSPIRRYMDLCHQRQFISFFRSHKPWLERGQLEPLAYEVEVHLNAAALASRETKRYWLLRYLEMRKRGEAIQGTVVRLDTKSPLVELDEVYLTLFVKTSRPVRMGEQVSLKIVSVDPHGDYVRLELA